MKLIVVLLSFALGALAIPASAQEAYNPTRVVKSIDTKDLVAIVNSLGDSVEDIQEENRLIVALTPDGVRYLAYGTACDTGEIPGCQGVMIQIRYDVPDVATYAGVNQANVNEAAIMTWMAEDRSTLAFVRYVILDHGVTMANLRENIVVLHAVAPLALAYVKGEN